MTPVDFPVGTRIEIGFGPAIPEDANALHWAQRRDRDGARRSPTPASRRRGGTTPRNSTSCSRRAATRRCANWWRSLDGCTGGQAGEIVADAGLGRMACNDVSREQAARLLEVARDYARAGQAEAARRGRS